MRRLLLLFLLLGNLATGQTLLKGRNGLISNSSTFWVSTGVTTSAGVYDAGGVLKRTLWSNQSYPAGSYLANSAWDGKLDDGTEAPNGNYTLKILSGKPVYQWLKPIGNTSTATTGSTVYHHFQLMMGMVQVGSYMYYNVGYAEVSDVHNKFAVGSPNVNATSLKGGGQVIRYLATDGNIVYSAGGFNTDQFITGIVPSSNKPETLASFSSGTPYKPASGSPFTYSIFDQNSGNNINGLSVMSSGSYLFSSHKSTNQLRVFNKTTGALVRTITSLTTPRESAIYGSSLWIISETSMVTKYTINSDGTIVSTGITLPGLTDPLSLAISPDGSKIAVANRGTYHQVKIYNTTDGSLSATLGRAESYSNPTVYDDKFLFKNVKVFSETDDGASHAFVAYQSDGSLWIGDYGNMRCQHFASNGRYIDNIQYMGYSYSVQVDVNKPTRVFSDFLEFNINYADNSWTYVKNWAYNVTLPTDFDADRLRSVATLSNGRTYALYIRPNNFGNKEVIELNPVTGIRFTGVMLDNAVCDMNPDGSIWQIGSNALDRPTFWKRKSLTGFDGSNNPQWGSYVTIETTPNVTADDPLTADGYLKRSQQTSTGVIATFSSDNGKPNSRGRGYHLGGFKKGVWVFKTSPSTRNDYVGSMPNDGAYDIGNGVNNPGSFMQVVDRHIFWGYSGEFWKGSQTNVYNHYLDNGLMIGQFGYSEGYISRPSSPEAAPKDAGNAISGTYVRVGNDIHFFHADEGQHAAIHHWKISNQDFWTEFNLPLPKTGPITLPAVDYVDLMASIPVSGSLTGATGRWSFSPSLYRNSDTDRWQAVAGLFTYQRGDRSLNLASLPITNGQTREAYCNLGSVNSASWRIEGELTYFELGELDDNFLDILDASGKVLVRISRPSPYPNVSIKANGQTIVNANAATLAAVLFNRTPLSIRRSGNLIYVKYGSYAEVSVAVLDAGSNLNNPATLRVRQYSTGTSGHQLGLSNLRLYVN